MKSEMSPNAISRTMRVLVIITLFMHVLVHLYTPTLTFNLDEQTAHLLTF